MVKQSLEDRLAALELKVTEWEARRRKLIPVELEADENVQLLVKNWKWRNYSRQSSSTKNTATVRRATSFPWKFSSR